MNKLLKFPKVILTIVMVLCVALPTLAHDFKVSGIYYNYLDKTAKTVEVTCQGSYYHSYDDEYTGSVTIPSSVTYSGTTYSVTEIGYDAFRSCRGLTSITIPNSVTEIGYDAFCGCTGLTSVTIGNSVTSIGKDAFYDCNKLSLVINLSKLTFSKRDLGNGCIAKYADQVINAPNGSIVKDFLFSKAYNGNTLVRYLGTSTKLTLPQNFNGENYIIGSSAYEGCWDLTSVTIPNSVTEIRDNAFKDCTGLTKITIPNSVTKIGESAFYNCYSSKSVTIGSSVTEIEDNAFIGTGWYNNQSNGVLYLDNCCLGYKGAKPTGALYLKEETRLIGNNAFNGCSGLTKVVIGKSVKNIGEKAFDGASSLNIIICSSPTPPVCANSNTFNSNIYSNATLYVPKDSYAKYFVDDVWGQFSNIKKIETLDTRITLSQTVANLPVNEIMTLTYDITPSNTPVEWSTSNPNVAYVKKNADGSATIVGMANGEAIVTVTDGVGASASCKVIVGELIESETQL